MADEDFDSPEQSEGENHDIRILRDKAKKFDAVEAELAQARWKLAVHESGIDTDSALGKFFVENFKGDPSKVEELVAQAKEVGVPFRGDSADPQGNEGTVSEVAESESTPTQNSGTDERSALAAGAESDQPMDRDPNQAALEVAQKGLTEGGMPFDEAAGLYINHKANSYMVNGDTRVTLQDRR